MISGLSLHKWVVGKMLFGVNRKEFGDALHIVGDRIQKETSQTPKLSIAFYKAGANPAEAPQLIGQSASLHKAPGSLWRKSDRIVATFTAAADKENPGIVATVSTGHPTRREIHFDVEPAPLGDKIGRYFVNVDTQFMWWARGIDR